jgi:hypothetical protein
LHREVVGLGVECAQGWEFGREIRMEELEDLLRLQQVA